MKNLLEAANLSEKHLNILEVLCDEPLDLEEFKKRTGYKSGRTGAKTFVWQISEKIYRAAKAGKGSQAARDVALDGHTSGDNAPWFDVLTTNTRSFDEGYWRIKPEIKAALQKFFFPSKK